MSYLASIVNFKYLPCPMSFTHRSLGPLANVEILLPGKHDLLIPSDSFLKFFAELRQLDISIRKTVSSITELKVFSSGLHVVPSHVNPRTHSPYTVCMVFDKSVL